VTQDSGSKLPDEKTRLVMVEVRQDFLRYLTRRLGNEHEASDVLHDFYVKVLRHIGEVRDTDKLRAWMRRVLETTLIDYYRAQSKKRRSESDHLYLETLRLADVAPDELDPVVCACLNRLLPTLKKDYADLLKRADMLDESRESIAATYGISENNLRVRLHRARRALRQRLEETCSTCQVHGYLDCGCDHHNNLHAEVRQGGL